MCVFFFKLFYTDKPAQQKKNKIFFWLAVTERFAIPGIRHVYTNVCCTVSRFRCTYWYRYDSMWPQVHDIPTVLFFSIKAHAIISFKTDEEASARTVRWADTPNRWVFEQYSIFFSSVFDVTPRHQCGQRVLFSILNFNIINYINKLTQIWNCL